MTTEKNTCQVCSEDHTHPVHLEQLPRIGRIAGQVEGIRKMIESHRHCPEIITQIRAIRSALRAVEGNIFAKHLTICVSETLATPNPDERAKQADELVKLFKRFDE